MASIPYTFSVRDNSAAQPGVRKTGLSPTWALLKRVDVSPATDITPQPAITEIGLGIYRFVYDAETYGEAVGQVDAGAGLSAEGDRYIDFMLTKDSGRVQGAINSDGKVFVFGGTGLMDAITDATPTATVFKGSTALSSTDNAYINLRLTFTSGALKGVGRKIKTYAGSTRTITLRNALPFAPADGDTFVITGSDI